MENKRRRSDQDVFERALTDELAFLRKFKEQAVTSLNRMRRGSVSSSSPWPFVKGDDDGENRPPTA
jgi:hypothetical protein